AVARADPDDPVLPTQHTAAQAPAPKTEPAPPADSTAEAPPSVPARTNGPDLCDAHPGPPETWWVNADYLLGCIKNGPLAAPLLTTGSQETGGLLGEPDTRVLLGNSSFDYGRASGGRAGGGAWLDGRHVWGLETDGFILERRSVHAAFASDSSGNPVL